MTSAPHLLTEDRPEYERILDEALRTAPDRPELAAMGERLTAEQLRTMVLNATALLTAAAAAEYDHYVKVREGRRDSVLSPHKSSDTVYSSSRPASAPAPAGRPRSGTGPAATDHRARAGLGRRFGAAVLGAGRPGGRRISDGVAAPRWARMSYSRRLLAALLGLHVRPAVSAAGARSPRTPGPPAAAPTHPTSSETQALETTEAAGAGLFTVFAVLAPVLSGTAAALFFLIGLVLEEFSAESGSGRTMFAAGWLFVAVAVGAIAVCAAGLLVTALRSSRDQPAPEAARDHELSEEVARAREAWRNALLERGIMPFLRDALADPTPPSSDASSRAPGRIPNLSYISPDFTSPGSRSSPASGPRPGHTSPDFAGQEHQPE
ncbi:hypothetical protein ACFCZ1_17320 [Streptomyces sp. NPDC056224]|uniref:hypothetical protein n=1 Tax=Streptomyces sp. NPDC056224 TaxID=3345750 RepID=UPI0035DA8E7C